MGRADCMMEPTERTLRNFACLASVSFFLLGIGHGGLQGRPVIGWCFGILGGTLAFFGLFAPGALRPLFVGWMAASRPIGWVSSHLFLALLFFGVFTPIALFFRLGGRDALRRRLEPGATSYWMRIPHHGDASSYFRQYG